MSLPRQVCIVGAQSIIQSGKNNGVVPSTTPLIQRVLSSALDQAGLSMRDLDGLIAVPSLSEPHFMEAHYQATRLGLFNNNSNQQHPIRCRTIDTGGAGPITALLEAVRMVQSEAMEVVALIAADCVASMDTESFLKQADSVMWKLRKSGYNEEIQSPAIPFGYDRVTQYQMDTYGLTRDQLRMAVSLESFHAGLHPRSLYHQKAEAQPDSMRCYTSLQQVQEARSVTPHISILECARRADGAACLIVASNRFLTRRKLYRAGLPVVIGGGESSGPLYPSSEIDESMFSCENAMSMAYAQAGNLTHQDIDFFGLYDCFPICLVRALEACGLSAKGQGGAYLQAQYERLLKTEPHKDRQEELLQDKSFFPVNTHGGLLCFGAPWEVPAMYNVVEAVHQLQGTAQGRQILDCRRALVYGNGGVFSASAVAILATTK